jgi:hypothetical protein
MGRKCRVHKRAPHGPTLAAAGSAVHRRCGGRLVEFVVLVGNSIEEAAAATNNKGQPSARDCEYTGRRVRDALSALAEQWQPVSKGSKIRGHLEDGAKPVAGAAGTRSVDGRVAHASGHVVRFSELGGETTGP